VIARRASQPDEAPYVGVSVKVSTCSLPAGGVSVGGDWCAEIALSEHAIALTVGDVSGHGEAVAGAMATMRDCVLQTLREVRVPSSVLTVANKVAANLAEGTLVTAVVAILDHRRQTLTFANAGHPPPLLLTREGHTFLERRPADLPLGVFAQHSAAEYVIALPLDALLVLYTDGITEHDRNPVRGETELVEAARYAFERPQLLAARTVARNVLRKQRGDDDAAALAVRTMPRRRP
jgi:serine phosphatase RsbU (regulator of sigma subunit)